jgi:hypothetical protein
MLTPALTKKRAIFGEKAFETAEAICRLHARSVP